MRHVANVLTREGDIEIKWDPENDEECAAAKKAFEELLKEGYEAYVLEGSDILDKVLGSDASKVGIEEFDSRSGELLMAKKVVVAPARVLGGYPKEGMNIGRV